MDAEAAGRCRAGLEPAAHSDHSLAHPEQPVAATDRLLPLGIADGRATVVRNVDQQ
jgi:hypothetical protein